MPGVVNQGPIRLDWEEDGKVIVLDKDKQRWLLTIQQAADACARGRQQIVWKEEFDRMLKDVHAWLKDHSALVSAAYVSAVEGQIVFFIVPKGQEMNFQLSDEIARLEVDLYENFANCRGEIRQIPGHNPDALATFLDLDQAALLYHGDARSTP